MVSKKEFKLDRYKTFFYEIYYCPYCGHDIETYWHKLVGVGENNLTYKCEFTGEDEMMKCNSREAQKRKYCFVINGVGFCKTLKDVYGMHNSEEFEAFHKYHKYVFTEVHPKPAGNVEYYECKVIL